LFLDSENKKVSIECISYWDVTEYRQDKFLLDPNGKKYEFYTETEAMTWLNANIRKDHIAPRYVDRTRVKFKSTDNRNHKDFYLPWNNK
jgi:hypothetical protein